MFCAEFVDQCHHRFGDAVLQQKIVGNGKDYVNYGIADACDVITFAHRPLGSAVNFCAL
jgi:hemerythrin-like domain-containing protein